MQEYSFEKPSINLALMILSILNLKTPPFHDETGLSNLQSDQYKQQNVYFPHKIALDTELAKQLHSIRMKLLGMPETYHISDDEIVDYLREQIETL